MALPSKVVDVAWYNFSLFTKDYKIFCKKSFGRILQYNPSEAMESKIKAQESIKKTWITSCEREEIIHYSPNKLPILFQLDVLLEINDGFKYTLDCNEENEDYYCVKYISEYSSDTSSSSGGYGGDFSGSCDGGS